MATFTAIQNKKQTAGALFGVLDYAEQDKKTRWGDTRLVSGHNCVPQSSFAEMQTTKERFQKTGGKQFYTPHLKYLQLSPPPAAGETAKDNQLPQMVPTCSIPLRPVLLRRG